MVSACMCRTLTASLLIALASTLAAQSNTPSFELNRDTSTSVTFSGTSLNTIVQGDFNSDQKPDLVIAAGLTNQFDQNTLVFRAGNGDGTFQPPKTIGITNHIVWQIAAADINGDGKLDLVTLGVNPSGPTPGTGFQVWIGNGDGTFQPPLTYAITGYYANAMAVADLNSDGLPDIAISDAQGHVEIWNNNGSGAFVQTKSIALTYGSGGLIYAGHFDGTPRNSLAVFDGVGVLSVLWNDGYENFTQTRLTVPQNSGSTINIGDLNQDGRDDILLAYNCAQTYQNSPGCAAVDVYYGEGNQTFIHRNLVTDNSLQIPLAYPIAADVNGDGTADIVTESGGAGAPPDDPQTGLYVWLGQPNGSYSQAPLFYHSTNHGDGALVAGDFNRDGMMDFAQTLPFDKETEIYINGGARAACATEQVDHTVTECEPVNDTWLPAGPLAIQANAYDGTSDVTAMQVYDNGQLRGSSSGPSLTLSYNDSQGVHSIITKAWDTAGLSYRTDRTINVYNGSPGAACPTAENAAALCITTTSVNGPEIIGNGWTANVPTAAQLYIDNRLVVSNQACNQNGNNCYGGTSYVAIPNNLAAGSHNVVFKLWDSTGNVYTAQKTVTVQ